MIMFVAMPDHDHCVYQLINRVGQVIYVGSSSALFSRLGQHAKSKNWWSEVRAISVESFPTVASMLNRETELIQLIDPIYNDLNGTKLALEMASNLLGYKVTRDDVRLFVASRLAGPAPSARSAPSPQGIDLRAYSADAKVDYQSLINWRARRPDFPADVAEGPNRAKLYDRTELDQFVAGRLREPVEVEE